MLVSGTEKSVEPAVGGTMPTTYAKTAFCMHIVCFEGEKKAQNFSPPPAGETPDPCHLSGPEMISYTFRHNTPSDTIHLGLPWGAAGAMDMRDPARSAPPSVSPPV